MSLSIANKLDVKTNTQCVSCLTNQIIICNDGEFFQCMKYALIRGLPWRRYLKIKNMGRKQFSSLLFCSQVLSRKWSKFK
ncbi:hypothetical protein CISIN_1g034909mg [Citrus sinensis]|uniref:Uncharacterized protein n=1 Tax=Citrus sinensis TaxID=2711 RepID=A0A067D5U9_CITSI|nr:hypothetical protein CISIN_1g034909mg [Citrus sinensis]